MRTHVKGVLTRNPTWEDDLIGYQIESGWIVGDWDLLDTSVSMRILIVWHGHYAPGLVPRKGTIIGEHQCLEYLIKPVYIVTGSKNDIFVYAYM